jgi:hypothetical protein
VYAARKHNEHRHKFRLAARAEMFFQAGREHSGERNARHREQDNEDVYQEN